MGMYTGLRFKGIVKPEFTDMIKKMMEKHLYWEDLFKIYPQHEFLNEFGEYSRSSFIPYGMLAYMPDEWETDEKDWQLRTPTDGFDRSFNEKTRLWSFQCSLKNYDSTIQKFFDLIVPQIIEESIHIEYYYEEWYSSNLYELKDGKVVESDKEGIKYRYDDSDYNFWGY